MNPSVTDFTIDSPVYIAGHRGLVGGAIWRALTTRGYSNLIGRTSTELDLRDRPAVFDFLSSTKPSCVVIAAARVGGISANDSYPVEFLSDNVRIQTNVMDAALQFGVDRLLFLGSSCIYPKLAPQPIREDALLTGRLEPTNEAYAIAKIAGVLQVQATRREYGKHWISAMPTNLYGPGDNFSTTGSHVLPALIRRYDEAVRSGARLVTNWGTGLPRRELLHVDDMATACLHLLEHYDGDEQVNIGTGTDATVMQIAAIVADAVGYVGETQWDATMPDGAPQKLLDVRKINNLGWRASIPLRDGIERTVEWFREHRGEHD